MIGHMKAKKPPVIILHGWAIDYQNHLKWQPLIDELNAAGVEATFFSLPGLSSPLSQAWGLNDYVNWLHKELSEYEHVILMGHSFGGQLAVRYTSIFPEKVQKLILIDAAGIQPFTTKAKVKRAVFGTAAKIGKVLFPFDVGRTVLHKLARERDYLEASPVMRETMRNVLADEVLEDMPNIAVETLILWGDQDAATPPSHARIFSAKIQHSRLHFIEGARHSPQFTHIKQVAEQVVEFLQ